MKKALKTLAVLAAIAMSLTVYAFEDVTPESWYYENVTEMSELGYLTGYDDGTFRPQGTVTKAEAISIICRAAGVEEQGSGAHWAQGYIDAALNAGLIDWDEIPPTGESFDEPITRQLAIKAVMKAFLPNARGDYVKYSTAISDFSLLSGRYYDSVLGAYAAGVVYGDENGCLNPTSNLTRAQMCALVTRVMQTGGTEENSVKATEEPTAQTTAQPDDSTKRRSGGVSENGALHVEGTNLKNESGENVVLRGVSSHGLQWYGNFASQAAVKAVADRGANLYRCAMYTAEGGYLENASVKNTLISAVDSASVEDMYVIIDWHILSDGNPMTNADAAVEFFSEMSRRYASNPAVIYEICNEPNGSITWENNVKPYAERVISAIRENSDGIILVGSPVWSQALDEAAASPLEGENIMYTCHFYAGTHKDELRQKIDECGLPVFVSEWGTSAADGGGGVYAEETKKWLSFMEERGISWANWSYCDKSESSAAIVGGANVDDGISDDELTESGKIVFGAFGE